MSSFLQNGTVSIDCVGQFSVHRSSVDPGDGITRMQYQGMCILCMFTALVNVPYNKRSLSTIGDRRSRRSERNYLLVLSKIYR